MRAGPRGGWSVWLPWNSTIERLTCGRVPWKLGVCDFCSPGWTCPFEINKTSLLVLKGIYHYSSGLKQLEEDVCFVAQCAECWTVAGSCQEYPKYVPDEELVERMRGWHWGELTRVQNCPILNVAIHLFRKCHFTLGYGSGNRLNKHP